MELIFVKAMYAAIALMVGYFFGRFRADGTEKQIFNYLKLGHTVTIIVDNVAQTYRLNGSKVEIEMSHVELRRDLE